jgi:hypothetical protein
MALKNCCSEGYTHFCSTSASTSTPTPDSACPSSVGEGEGSGETPTEGGEKGEVERGMDDITRD